MDVTVDARPAEPSRRAVESGIRAWVRAEAQANLAFEQSRESGNATLEAKSYADWKRVLRRAPISCARRRRPRSAR